MKNLTNWGKPLDLILIQAYVDFISCRFKSMQ